MAEMMTALIYDCDAAAIAMVSLLLLFRAVSSPSQITFAVSTSRQHSSAALRIGNRRERLIHGHCIKFRFAVAATFHKKATMPLWAAGCVLSALDIQRQIRVNSRVAKLISKPCEPILHFMRGHIVRMRHQRRQSQIKHFEKQ